MTLEKLLYNPNSSPPGTQHDAATMKVLSPSEGDALLTNAEVMHWIRDGKLHAPNDAFHSSDKIAPSQNVKEIARELLDYFERSPSGMKPLYWVLRILGSTFFD